MCLGGLDAEREGWNWNWNRADLVSGDRTESKAISSTSLRPTPPLLPPRLRRRYNVDRMGWVKDRWQRGRGLE